MEIEPKLVITQVSDASLLLEPCSRQGNDTCMPTKGSFLGPLLREQAGPNSANMRGNSGQDYPPFFLGTTARKGSTIAPVSEQSPMSGLSPNRQAFPLLLGL